MKSSFYFFLFGSVATAAASAGAMQHAFGWDTINQFVLPFIVLAFAAIAWLAAKTPARAP